jgi:hypothetical protein
MKATNELAADLEQRRTSLLAKLNAIPSAAASNPSVLAPDGPYTASMQDFLNKLEPYLSAEDRRKQQQRRHEQRVRHTQYVMASEFGSEASSAILKFYRSGIWPAAKLTP